MITDEFELPEEQALEVKRPLEPQSRALIIGASAGIGAALMQTLAAQGYVVAGVARRQAELEAVCAAINEQRPGCALSVVHDVTDYERVPALFQEVTRRLNGLDLVIYVAGVMPPVAANEYDFHKDKLMVEVNLLGAMAWLDQAAIRFQRAGRGHIVGIGSIAGDRGRRGNPAYHASKAGLHTYLESLRNRLSQHGVTVTTIKPGMVNTQMLAHVERAMWPISATDAADQIAAAIQQKRQTAYVPARWQLVSLIIRHLPSFIFRRLNF
ncbi:MAG: SDR family NAD(P)-dependent oxidoreductase [Anaerolineales bacterium]|nr:SDR family NAD(P)-dependent oxidoreductase [Anaerolineales bacterium]